MLQRVIAGIFVFVLAACSLASGEDVTARLEGPQIVIEVGGKPFTCYKYADTQKYPYFWPVCGPVSGKSVTTETSEPYPHHHSLFFGCDNVNGGNYWQDVNERGQIVSQGPKIVTEKGPRVTFTDECLWRQPGKDPIIRDRRAVTVSAPSATLRTIDFEITLLALVDIHVGKTNHSLFSGRVMPELSVKSGGTLVNAEGKTSEAGTYGVASPWCDYYGTREGVTEGMAIFQNPENRWYPSVWFTRDYGFFSPTPLNWEELKLARDEELTLRYRVVVHDGDTAKAGIAELFKLYSEGAQ